LKEIRKPGPDAGKRIIGFLDTEVVGTDDPRSSGKALKGELGEFWRYRVGDYRILCKIAGSPLHRSGRESRPQAQGISLKNCDPSACAPTKAVRSVDT